MTLSLRSFKNLINLQLRCLNCFIKVCLCTVREIVSSIVPGYKDISEEIVLISGGGRGIGRQIAFEFADYKPKHVCKHMSHCLTNQTESSVRAAKAQLSFGFPQ